MHISVAMATYNGEKYLREQLDSILVQITEEDEVVVSDDGSSDDTLKILNEYCKRYRNIKIIKGPQCGFVKNFENALCNCENDIVFLSDQDDIWDKKKVSIVRQIFDNEQVDVVMHTECFIDAYGQQIEKQQSYKSLRHGLWLNMVYSSYTGCCMAIRRKFLQDMFPFPDGILAHDQWIGLMAERNKSSRFIDYALTVRRLHGENVSKRLSFKGKIAFRIKTIMIYFDWKKKKINY